MNKDGDVYPQILSGSYSFLYPLKELQMEVQYHAGKHRTAQLSGEKTALFGNTE
jgi:hypothetical protein